MLWHLIRVVSSGSTRSEVDAAGSACAVTVEGSLDPGVTFVLQSRAGQLWANGRRLESGVANFTRNTGMLALFQESGVRELKITGQATTLDYIALAESWKETHRCGDLDMKLQNRGVMGIKVAHSQNAGVLASAPAAVADAEALFDRASVDAKVESQEASVAEQLFGVGQLSEALEPMEGIGEERTRLSLQRVLDALSRSTSQVASLGEMCQAFKVGTEALRASVLAVHTAEHLQWGEERGCAAGVAALVGAGESARGDAEVADLARAARAVASLMDAEATPTEAIRQLLLNGQLSSSLADAMTSVLN
ncbi:MAG: hypothetical protein VYE77_04765 [Planctomycetota bacterium]|nr:hypothetical protein [Planctomycetota bacterium]